MDNPYFVGIISWLFPGAGYILQRRWKRGILVGTVIWAMFIIAIISGGAYYPGFDFKGGALLYLLNVFANNLGSKRYPVDIDKKCETG